MFHIALGQGSSIVAGSAPGDIHIVEQATQHIQKSGFAAGWQTKDLDKDGRSRAAFPHIGHGNGIIALVTHNILLDFPSDRPALQATWAINKGTLNKIEQIIEYAHYVTLSLKFNKLPSLSSPPDLRGKEERSAVTPYIHNNN